MMAIKTIYLETNNIIGRLDRILSEFLLLTERNELDEVDAQTLKHHADDLIGVGTKALETLKGRGV
jgi:hypothetical protein